MKSFELVERLELQPTALMARPFLSFLAALALPLSSCWMDDSSPPPVEHAPPPARAQPAVPRLPCTETSCSHPAPAPADAPVASGPASVFAVTTWRLVSEHAPGTAGLDWTEVSYDLDGAKYEVGGVPHCQPVEGSKEKKVVMDGPRGEDNSFARNVLLVLSALDTNFVDQDGPATGQASLVLRLDALGQEASQLGLTGRVHRGRGPDGPGGLVPPGDDQSQYGWKVAPADTHVEGYVTEGTLVLRGDRIFVPWSCCGKKTAIWLPVHDVLLTAKLTTAALTEGRLVGRIRVRDVLDLFDDVNRRRSLTYCGETTLQGAKDQLHQSADLPLKGDHDPKFACDGISFGVGFEAAPSSIGGLGDLPVHLPVRCDGSVADEFGD